MQELKRHTWVEVNMKTLRQNYIALRENIPKDCKFMGVVKADAYGHGATAVAKELQDAGADYLSVAFLDEAISLRQEGITLPILILGYTHCEDVPLLLEYDLTQTVFDREMAKKMSDEAMKVGQALRVHIKADTGMSRLGFLCNEEDIELTVKEITEAYCMEGLDVEGIFTHCSVADEEEAYTDMQIRRFERLLKKLKENGCSFAIKHMANSAGILYFPNMHFDMVRAGIALYGYYPNQNRQHNCQLTPILELKSRVVSIKEMKKSTCIGYGKTHILQEDTKVAVISIGYGDGFSRQLSNCFTVTIGDASCPILGRICMDMCMVDVSRVEASVGDEVLIYSRKEGSGQTVCDAAEQIQTISYELLCTIPKRVPRIYL